MIESCPFVVLERGNACLDRGKHLGAAVVRREHRAESCRRTTTRHRLLDLRDLRVCARLAHGRVGGGGRAHTLHEGAAALVGLGEFAGAGHVAHVELPRAVLLLERLDLLVQRVGGRRPVVFGPVRARDRLVRRSVLWLEGRGKKEKEKEKEKERYVR